VIAASPRRFKMSTDTELIRFRVEPAVREAAVAACAKLGLELNDVLRALVTRIARDGDLPFELIATPSAPPSEPTPFQDYEPRLWKSLRPRVDAEVALALLGRFIAKCTARLDDLSQQDARDAELVARVSADRQEALRRRDALDVTDAGSIAQVLSTYGPRVRKEG
jgi:RelB antitoxin